jgi:glycosyltransferase involved in cell wall biosynthesis
MFECAKQSYLFSRSHHFLVPIPIDTDFWLPIPQDHARSILSLPKDKICILFGAAGGLKDYRKGGDLFLNILNSINSICTQYGFEVSDFLVVTFGRDSQISEDMTDFENVSLGQINSDETMRYLYSSCDLMVIPSRQDTLTCIGMEAQSCGLPVFCFDSCGVTDIVEDNLTGFISPSFDCYHLAEKILTHLSNECAISSIRHAARARAVTNWSPDVVAKQYQSIYELASKLTSL